MKYPTGNIYQLWLPWAMPAEFAQADFWLSDVEEAEWCWDGISRIDNKNFPTAVYFKHKEDYLVFRLRWPDLLKFK